MKLLTKEIERKLPPLYANEECAADEVKVIAKFFLPSGRWTWYATEFDGDDTFFGFVVSGFGSDCDELGYFSLSELAALRAPLRLGNTEIPGAVKVERDRYFGDHTLAEVMEAAREGRVL